MKNIRRVSFISMAALLLLSGPIQEVSSQTLDAVSGASVNNTSDDLPVVKDPLSRTESMIHTAVQIKIYHEGQEDLMDQAIEYIKKMEELLSTNIEGSDVYKINAAAGQEPVKVSAETFELIEKALEYSELTEGRFDITIGAVNDLWRIGQDDARVPSQDEIDQALQKIDYKKVILDADNQTVFLSEAGMRIELGGISKGYIGTGIADMFYQTGVTTAIINLGGNVIVMGTSPGSDEGWNVGVQDPDEVRGATVGTQRAKDYAIITSGIYERFLEVDGTRYHHILDPKTGYPLDNNISGVTVFAPRSTDGDALSTSLFLFGIEEGLEFVNQMEGVEAVFIDKEHGVYLSDGLKASFELSNEDYHLEN
ncbi:TPA: FAD:protein FMN transferase [Streptococcus suis]